MFKKYKKFLSVGLFIVLCLGLIGCKKDPGDEQPREIDTRYTDELKLATPYVGKNFLTDGIGVVTLSQNVDGDTAHFRSTNSFTVRFLSINTPESTGRIDPWGKAASKFVADILSKATTIVLESEEINKPAVLDATGKRYLAYVWYKLSDTADFRLLNLEIVEQCYSQFTGNRGEARYGDIFHNANIKSYQTKKRIFGERDPNYDYSNNLIELTIAELKQNFEEYSGGSQLKITARVMRLNGSNIYLEDIDETFIDATKEYGKAGIYMFSGYGTGLSSHLKPGQIISFKCQVVDNNTYGRQLTNPKEVRILENNEGLEVEVMTIPNSVHLLRDYEGFVVKLENVLVTGKTPAGADGSYTIYCKRENGDNINIRIDGSTHPKYPYEDVIIDARYDVIGGVSKFNETYQIMIGNKTNLQENDLLKK